MKNKEIRSLAKQKMQGKMGKAIGISIVYFLITFLMTLVLSFIPFIGPLAASIISVPIAFGYTKHIILLANGEDVGVADFLKHGFNNFGKVWCSNLWITLKCLLPVILIILAPASGAIHEILGFVLTIAAFIWLLIVAWKYVMVNYTLAYDNQDLRARDIVEKTAQEGKGKVNGFVCMTIYYGLLVFCFAFIISFVLGLVSGFLGMSLGSSVEAINLIASVISYIVVAIISLVFSIRNIAASNEYYKKKVLDAQETNNTNYEQNNINY